MVKDDIFGEDKLDVVPTLDDFLEEESKSKRKRGATNIFLEGDFDDDILDYDDDNSSDIGGTNPMGKNWSEEGMTEIDDLFDDDDF